MTIEDDLFNELDNVEIDPIDESDLIDTMVGPQGRYKSDRELAKAKLEADRFIERLKGENAELRASREQSTTLEAVMEKIKQELNPNRANEGQPNQTLENQSVPLDDSKIKALVAQLVQQNETERATLTNRQKVADTLTLTWGSDATIKLNQKARELDMPLAELRALADRSPSAFYRLVGLDVQAPQATSAPKGTVNLGGNSKNFGVNKPKSFYENLKITDQKKYFSKDVQRQMYNDAMKLGNDFFTN